MYYDLDIDVEYLRSMFDYEKETGLFFRKVVNHNRFKVGEVAGCLNNRGYVSITIDHKAYLAHRLAWLYCHGVPPKGFIDHINGLKDDNRIDNLRDVTQSLNMSNRKKHENNVSGYSGVRLVYENKKGGKTWMSLIKKDKQKYYLGTFKTEIEAYEAYLRKVVELYGEKLPYRLKQDCIKYLK